MPTQPNPNATSSTFQVGTYSSLSDTFTSVFDLNDGVNCSIMWNTLRMPQPEKAFVRSFNLRAPGERVTRFQYKNRHIQVSVSLRGSSVQAILNTCHSLIAAIENPPYRIRFSQPNATQYTYASVVAVTHNIPADPQTLLAKALPNIQIDFECLPGLLGDRVTLQNLIVNPGFEAPSGPGVQVFNDSFANTNAYASTFGSTPALNPANTFVDVVMANGGSNLVRYYRLGLGDTSGAALDIARTNQTGTPTGSPTQQVAGLVSGDTDTCYTFASASSQYIDCPTTGLPTGNSAISVLCRFKFAANPAGNQFLMTYGSATSGLHNVIGLYLDSTGHLNAHIGSGSAIASAVLTTGANHTAALTWDGTTLTLYLDGASAGTATPGAQTIPSSSLKFRLGATADTTAAGFFSGQIDEAMVWNTNLTSGQISAIHTAAATGATGTMANVMSIPTASRVAFGSPAWGAYNTWQARFRWVTSLTAQYYLHFTDGNNYLRCQMTNGSLVLQQAIAGTVNTLQTATPTLQHEAWYWVQITQFPAQAGYAPYVQATLYYDDAGVVGSQVTNGAVGPVATADGQTALSGRPQIMASGAALAIGGAFSNVHVVGLIGPGEWFFAGTNASSGAASLGWDQNMANTYPNGPVTSFGAARIDIAPAGTTDARLSTWDGFTSPIAQYGIPTAQNHVLGYSMAAKSSGGLSVTAGVQLVIKELNSSGTGLVDGIIPLINGTNPAGWQSYSGTYTIQNAATAYVRIQLRVTDTTAGGSANATVWFDNVQLWDQTTTGQTSMPYCELRFPQGPAQLMVSGLQGDLPAPAFVAAGAYLANWPAGGTLALLLGRRAAAHPAAQLIRYPLQPFVATAAIALDSGSYGGYYTRSTAGSTNTQANMLYIGATLGAALGAYHLIERAQTAQSAGNRGNISSRLAAFEGFAGIFSNQVNFFNAFVAGQFSASATWTLVDHGTLFVPLFTAGVLTDVSQQYQSCYGQWIDSTGGGSLFSFGVPWLLPVDADVLGATLINPTTGGGPITTAWLWTYSDALGQNTSAGGGFAWGFSIEAGALPAPAHSVGGPGTLTSGQISVNPNATPYLTLDPQAGAGNGAAGVNQAVGSLVDQSGALLPFHCELQYTPLYLYPR